MNLHEALQSAREGNFVTSEYFSHDQSMHYYRGNLYYEDGAVVSDEFLYEQDFAVNGAWTVSIPKENVDFDKLKAMHEKNKGFMLQTGSYMECRKEPESNEHELV